jgi:hypothetical protein
VTDTPIFLLGTSSKFALFFAFGMLIMKHYQAFIDTILSYRWLFFALFLVSFASITLFDYGIPKAIIGLCSVPAVYAAMASAPFDRSRILLSLGKYSFAIYLMNMIVIGLVKATTFLISSSDEYDFFTYFLIALLLGVTFPILIKKYFLVRIPVLDKITT